MSATTNPTTTMNIEQYVAAKRHSLQNTIDYYASRIEIDRGRMEKVEDEARKLFETKSMLEQAGFPCEIDSWSESIKVQTEKDKLTALYRVIGRLDGANAQKDVENARERLVRVTLTSVKYPFVAVTYLTKIPRKKGVKCRIETVRIPARVEKRLVCDR